MRLFSIHITKLLVAVAACSFCLQLIGDKGLESIPDSKFEDWKDIFKGTINADAVVLGSSRACANYDPSIIEKQLGMSTFNLGFNAASYNFQREKYNWYLQENETPKVIIQNIDLSHFKPSVEVPDPDQFIPFIDQDQVKMFLDKHREPVNELESLPLLKYNTNIDFLLKGWLSFIGVKSALFTSFNGFTPVDKQYVPDVHNLNRLKNNRDRVHNLNQDFYTAIEHYIKLSKKSTVILVWAPVYKDRRSLVTEKMALYKEGIIKAVNDNDDLLFLDYSNDGMAQETLYFYDSFHLNSNGAALFSNMLGRDIKELIKS